ncbi:MAG: FimB/Mfa2 family fimbrial subunit, partial [Prevotella sp.]|nr:FimB/Mfa2 family fimbrial subunit [Prevotella sp.]
MKPVMLYGLVTALFLCPGSCKNTDEEFRPDALPPVPEGYIRMQITVPGLAPAPTYALSTADETHVSTVDVLVFNASDNTFLCHAVGQSIATDGNDSNKKTFDVDLRSAGYRNSYVMVVANAHDAVQDVVDAFTSSPPTLSPATVAKAMQSMTFDSPGKWNVAKTNDTDFTPLPMWGMIPGTVSLGETNTPPVSMLRSVARIDVGVNFPEDTDDGTETGLGLTPSTTFTLEEVHLYNSL